jgi:hypothetical protein
LQRGEVAPRRESEQDVEISSPGIWRTSDEFDVPRSEHHRRQRPDRVAQPLWIPTIEAHPLAPRRAFEADADLVWRVCLDSRRNVKPGRPEPHEVLIAGAAH